MILLNLGMVFISTNAARATQQTLISYESIVKELKTTKKVKLTRIINTIRGL